MARDGVVLALAVAAMAGCSDSTGTGSPVRNQDFLAQANLQFDLDATPRTVFRVEGVNGDLSVVGVPGTESFSIRGTRQVWSESVADAQAYLDQLTIVVTEAGNEILIQTVQPQNTRGRRLVVDYVLTVPARLAASLANVNGSVTIRQTDGAVDVDIVNGSVTLDDLAGSIVVVVVNGAIACRATMAPGGVVDLEAVNGSLVLDIPQRTSAAFAAHLVNGAIALSNLTLQNPHSTPTALTGTLGGGQGTIDLSTVNGNILARGF